MKVEGILPFYAALSAKVACIWLSVWVLRKKGDVDYPLNGPARAVRWAMVVMGFAIGYYTPRPELWYVRMAGGFLGLAFLCWPNFAYYLTKLFTKASES
jgi:hypothetical protein